MKNKTKFVLFFLLGFLSLSIQGYSQSNERVIGSVFGSVDAGKKYEVYKNSADSFRDYLAGWQYVGARDERKTLSDNEIYDICLKDAKEKYGDNYPNLYLKDIRYKVKYEDLPDEQRHSQVVGSSTKYEFRDQRLKVYEYSATVVVAQ